MIPFWQKKFPALLLLPLALLFRLAVSARHLFYDLGLLPSRRLPVRVVSIGNITAGGAGKTPLVIHAAAELQRRGIKTAVVSRGYGRSSRGTLVVSDTAGLRASPREAGDEPLLIARRLPGVPVVVGADRVRAAALALKAFAPEIIILDDALQHRRLKRDLDIIVVNAADPVGNGFMLPAGPLRDRPARLKKAGVTVLTRTDQTDQLPRIISRFCTLSGSRPLVTRHKPGACVHLSTGVPAAAGELNGRRALCFAGIGSPGSFRLTAERAGLRTGHLTAFPDHHWYTAADLNRLAAGAHTYGCDYLLTTEKDAVRLQGTGPAALPLYYLTIDLEIAEPDAAELLIHITGRDEP